MSTTSMSPQQQTRAIAANRRLYWFSNHWMLLFSLTYGFFVGLPFLAPVFMEIGWEGAGKTIYTIFTILCHQLPQRSLFLFGSSTMYSLSEIQIAWQETSNPLILRQFIGNPDLGWKVAWSDRMISMYASILIFAWIWYPIRNKVKTLPWWGVILLFMPMGLDGVTHMISDFAGIGQGFRDSNVLLTALTNNAFPASFYAGDALGSFNSGLRWITGFLFGLGVVWFGFPYLDEFFVGMKETVIEKLKRARLSLSA
jgi:uncharacterized membrane protein